MSKQREKGVALITALLVLFLISAMIVGMSWMVMTDQRLGGNNANREVAFYGAEAGMEKMTADLGSLFTRYGFLTASNISTIVGSAPTIPGVTYVNAQGQSTYTITYQGSPANPVATTGSIQAPSPYAGLNALVTNYTLTVTANTPAAGEVKLQRVVQTSDIPVFQFGIFSNMDLGFHAGDNFIFGGRVHSNGNLWLAANSGVWLELPGKVTTAKEIITSTIMNGLSGWSGDVDISNGSSYVNLQSKTPSQSISGNNWNIQTLETAEDNNSYTYNTNFSSLASGTYNGNIGVKETGVTPLNLSIVTSSLGGQAIDLIRMPQPGEDVSAPGKLGLRYYGVASLRILLADYGPSGNCTNSDISPGAANPLPYISPGTPVDLTTLAWATANPGGYLAAAYPLPISAAAVGAGYNTTTSNGYWIQQSKPIITGCIKIDYQSDASPNTFTDITTKILSLGYTGPQQGFISSHPAWTATPPPAEPVITSLKAANCNTPNQNAVIRLAHVRDNPSTVGDANLCGTVFSQKGTDYWPNALFDPREGMLRDGSPTTIPTLAGTMYYVELDIANLSKCFTGTLAACSTFAGDVNNTTGYTVYFSDRRGNRFDPTPPPSVPPATGTTSKTGSFGYEDVVNESNAATGCPNNTLEQGEDLESDYDQNDDPIGTAGLRTYGMLPVLYTYLNGAGSPTSAGGWAMTSNLPLQNNSNCTSKGINWPFATAPAQDLRQNPPMVFRRALKLIHGKTITLGTCNTVVCGLTVASENPVYLQGDYNNPGAPATCSAGNFTTCFPNPDTAGGGVPASVAADAVTVLSNSWNDINSFLSPFDYNGRQAASQTTYRTAVVSGKGMGFPNPAGTSQDTGSDGGVHNFLRYIEDWSNSNLWYTGSFVALYYNHQAIGTFKCCTNVYNIPSTRNAQFDSSFLDPVNLPPRTPMLRNVNTIGFTQELLPAQ